MFTLKNIDNLKTQFPDKKLSFVHIPKCGGSYVKNILKNLNIRTNPKHLRASNKDFINFGIIRHPVDRFESFLNFRLSLPTPFGDWPKRLRFVHFKKRITLNQIVNRMTNKEMLSFRPYHTLNYFTQNLDVLITIEQLPEFLKSFGYEYNSSQYKKVNVSPKLRGKLNLRNRRRIERVFQKDMELYEKFMKNLM